MSFSTLKSKQSLHKINLVRIEPRRYINSDLSVVSGNLYQATVDLVINALVFDGVTGTRVTVTPSTDHQWSYDETTNILQVYDSAGIASSNPIILFHYLFYTNNNFRYANEEPDISSATMREWEPKLVSIPKVRQNIENILKGVLSTSQTNLTIINDNYDFNRYLTPNDSFKNVRCGIWIAFNDYTDLTNIQKIYDGVVASVEPDRNKVSFRLSNQFDKFNLKAFLGDRQDENYFTVNNFTINPSDEGTVIPFILSPLTKYQIQETNAALSVPGGAFLPLPDSMLKAVCTSFNIITSGTVNRTWTTCRTHSDGMRDISSPILAVTHVLSGPTPQHTRIDVSVANAAKYYIGDSFEATSGAGNGFYLVVSVDYINGYLYCTYDNTINAVSASILHNDIPTVGLIQSSNSYILTYGVHYTVGSIATSGGNLRYNINFMNNFESSLVGGVTLDPTSHSVFFRVGADVTNLDHAKTVQFLCESAGLTVNTASITAASSALSVNPAFQIPYDGESDFANYTTYLENLLSSTLGYIHVNNSFEIEYHLFDVPSSSTEITDTDILADSFEVSVDYDDIITELVAFNPYLSSSQFISQTSATRTSKKPLRLHGIENIVKFQHYIDDITLTIDDIFNLKSERLALYKFVTKNLNLDTEIGDDFKLNKSGLLGTDTTKDITILSVDKSTENVELIGTDLLGL